MNLINKKMVIDSFQKYRDMKKFGDLFLKCKYFFLANIFDEFNRIKPKKNTKENKSA